MLRAYLLALLLLTSVAEAQVNSVYVYNTSSGDVVEQSNSTKSFPIASITKVMTVLVVLESHQDMDEVLVVSKTKDKSKKLSAGMKVTRGELVRLALVCSDNKAARTLGDNYYTNVVDAMNAKAIELGMLDTHYEDPTGILSSNVSTASDLTKLLLAANKYPQFNEAAQLKETTIEANVKSKHRLVSGHATNPLAGDSNIRVAKTGFTNAARKCMAILYEYNNQLYSIVVLGSRDSKERKKILQKAVENIT